MGTRERTRLGMVILGSFICFHDGVFDEESVLMTPFCLDDVASSNAMSLTINIDIININSTTIDISNNLCTTTRNTSTTAKKNIP